MRSPAVVEKVVTTLPTAEEVRQVVASVERSLSYLRGLAVALERSERRVAARAS